MVVDYAGDSAPAGWLMCDGSTIGKVGSGADHESAAYETLFDRIKSELGKSGNNAFVEERACYRAELQAAEIGECSLPAFCRQADIGFHVVPEINGKASLQLLDRLCPDYAVYSGAGILRKGLIERISGGILNLHCGPLPHIRGMNAVEWSLLFGVTPEVTLHLIDAGIDTGPILASRTIDVQPGDRIARIRARTVLTGIELLAEILPQVDTCPLRENPTDQGRQYFAMSSALKRLVQQKLDHGVTPTVRAADVPPRDLQLVSTRRAAA